MRKTGSIVSAFAGVVFLLAAASAFAQDSNVASLCSMSPGACLVSGVDPAANFKARPEIEFSICDIWPDACHLTDVAAIPVRKVDLCSISSTSCVLHDPGAAIKFAQENGAEPVNLCRLAPEACAPRFGAGDMADRGGPPSPGDFDICDIWQCETAPLHTQTFNLEGCSLVPDACDVVDAELAHKLLSTAIEAAGQS